MGFYETRKPKSEREARFMIRMAKMNDIPAMLDIYGPYVLHTTFTFEYTVPTREAFAARFRTVTAQCPWLVWEEDGAVLGYAYGSLPFERAAYAWCGEVSIYLAPEARGRGIGRRLYGVLEHILWQQGYRVIYSLITSENTASLAFHEKLGYRRCAELDGCGVKFGRWLGVIWMEKRPEFVEIPTCAPVPWLSIVENDRKLQDILANLSLF